MSTVIDDNLIETITLTNYNNDTDSKKLCKKINNERPLRFNVPLFNTVGGIKIFEWIDINYNHTSTKYIVFGLYKNNEEHMKFLNTMNNLISKCEKELCGKIKSPFKSLRNKSYDEATLIKCSLRVDHDTYIHQINDHKDINMNDIPNKPFDATASIKFDSLIFFKNENVWVLKIKLEELQIVNFF